MFSKGILSMEHLDMVLLGLDIMFALQMHQTPEAHNAF